MRVSTPRRLLPRIGIRAWSRAQRFAGPPGSAESAHAADCSTGLTDENGRGRVEQEEEREESGGPESSALGNCVHARKGRCSFCAHTQES